MSALGCLRAGGNSEPRSFELAVEARCQPGAAAGIRFHKQFEIRVGNGQRAKTGSLVELRGVYKSFVPDGEWFRLEAAVRANHITVKLNGMTVVDYVHPASIETAPATLHGPRAEFRNLRIQPLGDQPATPPAAADAVARQIAEAA